MKILVEDHAKKPSATVKDVQKAITKLARPDGPTFIVLTADNGDYAQAGGADGRYVVEYRMRLGEGFRHYRVCHDLAGPDAPTVVYYRRRCIKNEHPPRRCPIEARASEVCSLAEAEHVLLHFVKTGDPVADLDWRDTTDRFDSPEIPDTITTITPRRS